LNRSGIDPFDTSRIRALPGDEVNYTTEELQQLRKIALTYDKTTLEDLKSMRERIQKEAGEDGVFKVMDKLGLDFVCSCTDGPISEIAALAGT
jgi:hypothetical protein